MRVIFACAGTGGHVNPAIAIANVILKNSPKSEILFIGTKSGIENDLVKKAGFEIKHIRTGKIIRSITLKNIKALFNAYKGISDAKKIIQEFNPDIVIGTGGYICGPVMLAAKDKKIPYILHESNAFPGIAIKLLAKKADKVLIGFEDARKRLKNRSNIVFTGTPTKFTKQDIEKLDIGICKKEFKLEKIDKKIVVVMCGSQGAKKINEIVLDMLKNSLITKNNLMEEIYIILVTGNNNYEEVLVKKEEIQKELKCNLEEYINIEKYIYDMEKMYKIADLCITRAGAMTITELEIVNKPSILIPFPSAAENHQLYNAKVLEDLGIGIVIEQKDLTSQILVEKIKYLIENSSVKNNIEENKTQENKTITIDSAQIIYKCIEDVLSKRGVDFKWKKK
jgi:UDP-N-acetylglucosamine--N-acetylmuramyl-(pentapeptide) pyrophosphoryl-undecaprenol N-acetylglucosamine transferase